MYDIDALKDILSLEVYRAIGEDGLVFKPSAPVYKEIAKAMENAGSKMSPKHVYQTLKENRNGLLNYVITQFVPNLVQEKSTIVGKEESFDDSGNEETFLNSQVEIKSGQIKFKIVLSAKKWASIKPTKIKNNQKLTLRKNKWTDVMADTIYNQTKITCAFAFKKSAVLESSSAKYYVKINGHCKECGACLIGIIYHKPKKDFDDVLFHIKLTNFQYKVPHLKRRQLRGERRECVARELIRERKAACLWRNEQANMVMEFGDPIPPTLPNTEVLRKAKQTELNKMFGFTSFNPIENLITLQHTSLDGFIHFIGASPFFCIYYSPEQIAFHKFIAEKDSEHILVADASGGFVYKICLPIERQVSESKIVYESSKYIYLYIVKCISCLGNISLYQMLSSKHDASFLSYFFSQILQATGKKPKLFITDFSKALLVAISRSYANCSDLKEYLSICFKHLVLQEIVTLPTCCLSLDVSHFVAMIARWKCLKGQKSKVRQLFLRSLAHINQMNDILEIKKTLTSLLVVSMSQDIGYFKNKKLPAQKHLEHLNNVIRGIPEISNEFAENQEDSSDPTSDEKECYMPENITDLPNESSENWISWSKMLFEQAKEISYTLGNKTIFNVNPFYLPKAAEKIKELTYWLPLWTRIMHPSLNVQTEIRSSSTIESEFSKLKNHVFYKLPMKVDKFVVCHHNYLQGELKLVGSQIPEIKYGKKSNASPKKSQNSQVFNLCQSLAEVENWKGKNKVNLKPMITTPKDSSSDSHDISCTTEYSTNITESDLSALSINENLNLNCTHSQKNTIENTSKNNNYSPLSNNKLGNLEKAVAFSNSPNKLLRDEGSPTNFSQVLEAQNLDNRKRKPKTMLCEPSYTDKDSTYITESDVSAASIDNSVNFYSAIHCNHLQKSPINETSKNNDYSPPLLRKLDDLEKANAFSKSSNVLPKDEGLPDNFSVFKVQDLENKKRKQNSFHCKQLKSNETYLSDFPEWNCMSGSQSVNIPIMQNGSAIGSMKIGKTRVQMSMTCAFDSFLIIFMQAMHLSKEFNGLVQKSKTPLALLALDIIKHGKLLHKHYLQRYELLSGLWLYKPEIDNRYFKMYNCATNIAVLTNPLLNKLVYSYSMKKICSCGYQFKKSHIHVPIHAGIAIETEKDRIQKAIDDRPLIIGLCTKCKKAIQESREFGPIFLIDLSETSMDPLIFKRRVPFYLKTIDKELSVQGNKYIIVGVIHFTSYGEGTPGHYKAFFYNGQNWFEYDDLKPNRSIASGNKEIVPHLLFYIKL